MAIVRGTAIIRGTVMALSVMGLSLAGPAWATDQWTSTDLFPLGTSTYGRISGGNQRDSVTMTTAGTQMVNGALTTVLDITTSNNVPVGEYNIANGPTSGLLLYRARLFGIQFGSPTTNVTVVFNPAVQILKPIVMANDFSHTNGIALITPDGGTPMTAQFDAFSTIFAFGTVIGTPAALAPTVHTLTQIQFVGQAPANGVVQANIDWGWNVGPMKKILSGPGFGNQEEFMTSTNTDIRNALLFSSTLPTGLAANTLSTSFAGTAPVAAASPGATVTAFGAIANGSTTDATSCGFAPLPVNGGQTPWNFVYAETDPATNQVVGPPNPLVTIPAGGLKTFVFAFQPTQAFGFQNIHFVWDCGNSAPAATIPGVNTFGLFASAGPTPNILMLSATVGNTGYANIPGDTGTGFFSVAASNLGAASAITVSGGALTPGTPVIVTTCETDSTGACKQAPAVQVAVPQWAANENRTFAFFVQGTANVSDSPATNRIDVKALDPQNNQVGGTGVAIRTVSP